jgi:hypothetical protein
MSILLNDVFVLKYLAVSTVPPPCGGYIMSTILVQLYNASSQSWTEYSYVYTATASQATLMFCFMNAKKYWALDDVSMVESGTNTNLILNPGFETGDWTDWTHYYGYNSSYDGSGMVSSEEMCSPHSGNDFYANIQYTTGGEGIFQNVTTVPGTNYNITFYLANPAGGKPSVAIVSVG